MANRARLIIEVARGLIFVTLPIVCTLADFCFDVIAVASVWMPPA